MKKLIVMTAALAMVATFAMTAAAADWNFYGSSRIETFYTTVETVGAADADNYTQSMPNNSRIGANVKVSDELTGRFEYGTDVNTRLLYGEWNFGAGSLLVGQDYTPVMMAFSGQMYDGATGLIGYGAPYGGRVPQIKLRVGDFQLAFIRPTDVSANAATIGAAVAADALDASFITEHGAGYSATDLTADNLLDLATAAATYAAGIDFEYSIPRIEVSYFADMGPLRLRGQGGYATVDMTDATTPALSTDFDAYILAVGATYTMDAFYVTGTYAFGENLTVLGIATNDSNSKPFITDAGTWDDAQTNMWQIFAGFKANDMFSFEAGYGRETTDVNEVVDEQAIGYYFQTKITLAPGVYIIPEIGVQDTEDIDAETKTYYGAVWQINF